MRTMPADFDTSLAEFLDLARQPYSQPTIAALLDRWFGYSLSGSYGSTEVRSVIGEPIDLRVLHQLIQSDRVRRQKLHDAAIALRR
ncbi:MAG: hypothetical protein WDN03_06245 [Rhizomicrobium sp.]